MGRREKPTRPGTPHSLPALATLTPRHHAVLYQVYFADQTYAEAAKALGTSEGTVKSRLYYALRRLRLALDEETAQGGPSTIRSAARP